MKIGIKEALLPEYAARLKRKGVTVMSLFEEYSREHPDGFRHASIVPDNLKSAVTRSNHNEPIINDDFAAFAEHYGCAVYPARVRHLKNKALWKTQSN